MARLAGVKFGRPRNIISEGYDEVYKCWRKGEITAVNAMKQLNMTKATFYRSVNEYEATRS